MRKILLLKIPLFIVVVASWGMSWGYAQADLNALLTALQTSPEALELRATLDAAAASLQQERSMFNVAGSASYSYLPDDPDATPVGAGVDLSFDPLILGDDADDARTAELEFQQAELVYARALAQLQIDTILDALDITTAEQIVAVREQAAELAALQVQAATAQLERGSGTNSELRDAELELDSANLALQNAADALTQARSVLTNRVGEVLGLRVLDVEVPEGDAVALRLAVLERDQTQITLSRTQRNLYPTLSAGYTQQLGANAALGASIDSDDLSPNVSFDYNPGDDVTTRVRIGIGASFSPADVSATKVAQRNVDAATFALDAAQRDAALQRSALERSLAQAEAQEALAQRVLTNAQTTLGEVNARVNLGLSTPLATAEAEQALAQAELELRQARLVRLSSELAFYPFTATLLTEVQP